MKIKIMVIIGFVLMTFGLINNESKAAIPTAQRNALIALYNATNGNSWTDNTDWNGTVGTECDWYGITCDAGDEYVEWIELDTNNLVGTIPDLSGITTLITLDLHSNSLNGSIPATLGSIISLVYLSLYDNSLSGTIPSTLNNLVFLDHLNLSDNNLSDPIPDLSDLDSLDYLNLSNNSLSGNIPSTLGDLDEIIDGLLLSDNDLTGSIPSALGDLTQLLTLDLSNNQLSSTIPSELGGMNSLEYLYLNGNRLEGPIPTNLDDDLSDTLTFCDIRWNALYTSDNPLSTFFTSIQTGGDWEGTQTIAPTNFSASPGSDDESMVLSWTAIAYQTGGGGYDIDYRSSGGGWNAIPETNGRTSDKSIQTYTITGLTSGTDYEFRIRTITDAHANNDNTVTSRYAYTSSKTSGDDDEGGCFIGSTVFKSSNKFK